MKLERLEAGKINSKEETLMPLYKNNKQNSKRALKSLYLASLVTLSGCETVSNTVDPILEKVSVFDNKVKEMQKQQAIKDKAEMEKLKAQMSEMAEKQGALQQKLARQKIKVVLQPTKNVNAGKGTQATASTAYLAVFEDQNQFTDVQSLANKEFSIIPDREVETTLNLPDEAKYIAIKIGLRYTKKRSQFLIPIESLDFETPLSITIGACDAFIEQGIDPELSSTFIKKLKFYQTPLVSCS